MDEIIPKLWIGDWQPPAVPVDAIVDCQDSDETRLSSLRAPEPRPFLWVPFHDSTPAVNPADLPPRWLVALALNFIWIHQKAGRSVLVQCFHGKNRSAYIVASHLISGGMKPADAIALIRSKRGADALSNPIFVAALENAATM